MSIRLQGDEKAQLRRLADLHRLPLGPFLVECGLGRLHVGRDRVAELERRLELVEAQLARAQSGY